MDCGSKEPRPLKSSKCIRYQVEEPDPGPPGQPGRDLMNHAAIVRPSAPYKVSDDKIQDMQGDNLARVEATLSHHDKKTLMEQKARINGGGKDQGAMEIGYDVKTALALGACAFPVDESRLKKVQTGSASSGHVEKRGLTKLHMCNYLLTRIQRFEIEEPHSMPDCSYG